MGHTFATMILNGIKRLPCLMFALTAAAAKAEGLRLHCASEGFWTYRRMLAKTFGSRKEFAEFCWVVQIVPKVRPLVLKLLENVVLGPHLSAALSAGTSGRVPVLHWDIKLFRCFGCCTTKCWKHRRASGFLLIFEKKYCYFLIVVRILLEILL